MVIELPWDSTFFNFKIGKITINSLDEINFEDINTFDLIYVYANEKLILTNKLEIKLVDEKITFQKNDLKNRDNFDLINGYVIKEIISVTSDLKKLVLQSGNYSRFKIDSNFNQQKFQELYYEWIDNSVYGNLADIVLGVFHLNKVVGFVTLKKHLSFSRIGLIAIDETYRGLGLGKLLLSYMEKYCLDNNINTLEVVTQNNNPACLFYSSCGYLETNKSYIYHLWNYKKI